MKTILRQGLILEVAFFITPQRTSIYKIRSQGLSFFQCLTPINSPINQEILKYNELKKQQDTQV